MIVRLAIVSALALTAGPGLAQRGGAPPPACTNNTGNAPNTNPNCPVIALTIESDLDFGRLVLLGSGAGQVWLDLATGQRYITGGIDDAGGMPVVGRAAVTGAPMRAVRIDMPASITMTDAAGGQAVLREFRTSLPAAPMLDTNGQLNFTFTGTLTTQTGIALGGRLRGRVPISVSYD